jgi:uncharacterized iron-regulated membrane protein
MSVASQMAAPDARRGLDYRAVWRWHFYAGLFCIPFVIWLACTGSIFLFHPQIQRWIDRPYEHLTVTAPASANLQAQAALAAVPGSMLHFYQLPEDAQSAAQVVVDKGDNEYRVYIHPQTLAVLKIDDEDRRLMNLVFRMHGELMIGNTGSYIVELAASWAVIMIVTGLVLWWPRDAKGLGGLLYPRLGAGGRVFWRDIHSVTGGYISCLVLFQLFTGLPWAKSWGSYLKLIRHTASGMVVQQDWTTSTSEEKATRLTRNGDAMDMSSEHAHMHHSMAMKMGPNAYVALDKMVATVAPLGLAYPVEVAPPMRMGGNWTAKSDARNRPLRVNLVLDGKTGAILSRQDFSTRPWLDRVIGTAIAIHEGQHFGLFNQLLGLFTAVGLVTLVVSGVVMWWRRRPEGALGAPQPLGRLRFSFGLVAAMVAFGIYFPLLGGSMILVGLTERFILRRIPGLRRWLGLREPLAA